ncbi:hypothetical protein JCM15765_17090 [Paradesulfitobacterium aromaticivorans]
MGLNFADSLKKLAADKSSRLLGTECLNGRPALHLQFNQTVKDKGEMVTHLWMDKDTWMPLVTEWYNAAGEPVQRKVVREVRFNQGLSDERFSLELPPDVHLKDNTQQTVQPLQDITLAEAKAHLGGQIFAAEAALTGEVYQAKYQWLALPEDKGVLLTQYFIPGEPLAQLTVTQAKTAHANIPAQMPSVPVRIPFAGMEVEGRCFELGLGPMKTMLVWSHSGRFFTAGGDFDRDGLLSAVGKLSSRL